MQFIRPMAEKITLITTKHTLMANFQNGANGTVSRTRILDGVGLLFGYVCCGQTPSPLQHIEFGIIRVSGTRKRQHNRNWNYGPSVAIARRLFIRPKCARRSSAVCGARAAFARRRHLELRAWQSLKPWRDATNLLLR